MLLLSRFTRQRGAVKDVRHLRRTGGVLQHPRSIQKRVHEHVLVPAVFNQFPRTRIRALVQPTVRIDRDFAVFVRADVREAQPQC